MHHSVPHRAIEMAPSMRGKFERYSGPYNCHGSADTKGCQLLWGIFTCCLSVAKTSHQVYGLRFLIGFFEGTTWPAYYTIISQWYLPHEVGLRMSLYNIAQPAGAMLSGATQGALATTLHGAVGRAGWRWAFIINVRLIPCISSEFLLILTRIREFAPLQWLSPLSSSCQAMYVLFESSSRGLVLITWSCTARASKPTCQILPQTTTHRDRISASPPSEPQATNRDHPERFLPLLHLLATMGIWYCMAARGQHGSIQLLQPLAEITKEPRWHKDILRCLAQLYTHRRSSHPASSRGHFQWCQRLLPQKTSFFASPFCHQHNVACDTHYSTRHTCYSFRWLFPQLRWSVRCHFPLLVNSP